jgi:hypothetical protein
VYGEKNFQNNTCCADTELVSKGEKVTAGDQLTDKMILLSELKRK